MIFTLQLPEGAIGVKVNGVFYPLIRPKPKYRGFFTKVGRKGEV